MDRFEEMHTFVQVVDSGSLSAAAEKLSVAKSAVSRRLADLEGRLGVQLLNRTTRRLNLTESGRSYYQRCQRILLELSEAELAVSSEHRQLRGTIRVAAPLSFGIGDLSPVLNGFMKAHPEVVLDLELNDRTVNVMQEGVDLAIRIGSLADSTLVARRLFSVNRMFCASPSYLQEYGEPETPEALERHCGLSYSLIPDEQIWSFGQNDGSRLSVNIPIRMRANNGDILLKAAIDGLGIVPSPDFICRDAVKKGLLTEILSDYPREEISAYAIYPAQRHLPSRVRE
ncbi:MAG: LysR family transcriptional regulator, partial [Candidatus Sedimenticola sp. (ex Thyasira tokunagai)]